MFWLDEIGGVFASNYVEHPRVVTARFGGLDFNVPTELEKVVDFWARVKKEEKTSLTVEIIATKKNMGSDEHIQVAHTEIVFVAVDEDGHPCQWNKKT